MAHLLLVDDEQTVSRVLERRLKSLGHSIVGCAENAADSIDMARKYNPDLVFMDIMMPGEMDGIDAAEVIGREFNIPIIFLTAWADDTYLERAKLTMPYAYIIKPYHMNEIKAAIDMTLYRSGYDRMLASAAGQFMSMLEAIDSMFISLKEDFTIHHINRAGYQLLGTKNETLHGIPFTDCIVEHAREAVLKLLEKHMSMCDSAGVHSSYETITVELSDADGFPLTHEMVVVPCATPAGPQLCLIGVQKAQANLHCSICSHCKRIRDDRNQWIQLESYLSTALEISFSHSICPSCIKKYYPDLID